MRKPLEVLSHEKPHNDSLSTLDAVCKGAA